MLCGLYRPNAVAVSGRSGFAEYVASSSRTRALSRWRRRTIAETVSIRSWAVSPRRTFSTASHTSSGVSPSSTRETASSRRAPGSKGEDIHLELVGTLAAAQTPELPYPQISVAFDPALVEARDLGFDDQIGGDSDHEIVGGRDPFAKSGEVALGPLADVERTVGLHPRTRRLAPSAKSGVADSAHRARERASRYVHDLVDELRQVFMQARRGHQGDDPKHRVEPDPAEVPVPVHRRERGDGVGVGPENVNGGAERPGVRGGGVVHEGGPPKRMVSGRLAAKPPGRILSPGRAGCQFGGTTDQGAAGGAEPAIERLRTAPIAWPVHGAWRSGDVAAAPSQRPRVSAAARPRSARPAIANATIWNPTPIHSMRAPPRRRPTALP